MGQGLERNRDDLAAFPTVIDLDGTVNALAHKNAHSNAVICRMNGLMGDD